MRVKVHHPEPVRKTNTDRSWSLGRCTPTGLAICPKISVTGIGNPIIHHVATSMFIIHDPDYTESPHAVVGMYGGSRGGRMKRACSSVGPSVPNLKGTESDRGTELD